jgi:uncharacterized damage-inducible protein DinB
MSRPETARVGTTSSPDSPPNQLEPWLRGTNQDMPAAPRATLHALELAREDLDRWCRDLTDQELHASPSGLPAVAFHLRHIARSLDRLLTYAEGRPLTKTQLASLKTEMDTAATRRLIFAELLAALETSAKRIRTLAAANLEQPRTVGKKSLPTTLGGLLVHVADHTQRHVGQAITTAKLLLANRKKS